MASSDIKITTEDGVLVTVSSSGVVRKNDTGEILFEDGVIVNPHGHIAPDTDGKNLKDAIVTAHKAGVSLFSINNYVRYSADGSLVDDQFEVFNKTLISVVSKMTSDEKEIYKNIKIVPSFEIPAKYNYTFCNGKKLPVIIHLVGHGIDLSSNLNAVNDLYRKYAYSVNQADELERLKLIARELGYEFNDDSVSMYFEQKKYAGSAISYAMAEYEVNYLPRRGFNPLPRVLMNDPNSFYNMCEMNPLSPFYDYVEASYKPALKDVLYLFSEVFKTIVVVAHPAAYFPPLKENDFGYEMSNKEIVKLISELVKYPEISGVETYVSAPTYNSNNETARIEIKKLLDQWGKFHAGGNDAHRIDPKLGDASPKSGHYIAISKNDPFYKYLSSRAISLGSIIESLNK